MASELTTQTLRQLEVGIEHNIAIGTDAWQQVAKRLDQIRDRDLWKPQHKSFKDYCRTKWGKTDSWARHLIADYKSVNRFTLSKGEAELSQNSVRTLKTVEPSMRQQVVTHASAADDGHVTPSGIRASIRTLKPPKVEDDMGVIIPEPILEIWERRAEIEELMAAISKVKCRVERGRKEVDPLFMKIEQDTIHQAERVYYMLAKAMPYCVCGECEGRLELRGGVCGACKNTGFMSKEEYRVLVPEEKQNIRKKGIELRKAKTK